MKRPMRATCEACGRQVGTYHPKGEPDGVMILRAHKADGVPCDGSGAPADVGKLLTFPGAETRAARGATGARKPYKFDTERRAAYLAELEAGATRSAAASNVGVSRQTVYDLMNRDATFTARVRDAEKVADDHVEHALFMAATEDRNVTAIQVWLYNRRPERWRDQRSRDLLGQPDEPETMTDAERIDEARRIGEELLRRAKAAGASTAKRAKR